jgi:hypothetical protein
MGYDLHATTLTASGSVVAMRGRVKAMTYLATAHRAVLLLRMAVLLAQVFLL